MDNFKNIITLILGCNGNFKTILESNDDGNFNMSKLEIGDLILRRMLGTKTKIYHAGVFCGQNDVIQFSVAPHCSTQDPEGRVGSRSKAILNNPPSSFNCSVSKCQALSEQTGEVDKVSVKKFISGQKYFVLRLTTGPPRDLQENINMAMDDNRDYHLFNNNCLHFALRLLGGTPGPMPRSQPMDDEDERSESEELKALTTQN
ncbi:unnamed protein product [Leuciscus chuanchicus]